MGGCDARNVLVLVDREQGGRKKLKTKGYDLYAVWTVRELLDFFLEAKLVPREKYDETVAYLAANQG